MGAIVNLGLVVSTLGRAEPLERLLRVPLRAAASRRPGRARRAGPRSTTSKRLVAALPRRRRSAIDVTTSARGASRGRNAGVAALEPGERLLHFPNDTTWFPDGASTRSAARRASDVAGGRPHRRRRARPQVRPAAGRDTASTAGTSGASSRWGCSSGARCSTSSADSIPTSAPARRRRGRPARPPTCCCGCSTRVPTSPTAFGWLPHDVAVGGIADPQRPVERRTPTQAACVRTWAGSRRGAASVPAGGGGSRSCSAGSPSACGTGPTNAIGDGWWVFLGRAEGMLGRTIGGRDRRR